MELYVLVQLVNRADEGTEVLDLNHHRMGKVTYNLACLGHQLLFIDWITAIFTDYVIQTFDFFDLRVELKFFIDKIFCSRSTDIYEFLNLLDILTIELKDYVSLACHGLESGMILKD